MPEWYILIRRPLSMFQTLLGVLVFSYSLPKRKHYWIRLTVSFLIGCVVCYFAGKLYIYPWVSLEDSFFRLLSQLIQLAMVLLIVYLCIDVSGKTATMLTGAGYCVQGIAGSLKAIIRLIPEFVAVTDSGYMLLLDLVCYAGTYMVIHFLFRRYTQSGLEILEDKQKIRFALTAIILCIIVGRLTQDNPSVNTMARFTQSFFSILSSWLILVIQFGVSERQRLENNVETLEELIHQQHTQFRQSKETVALVNEKYHDLKGLLESFNGQISQSQIDNLKDKVNQFDAVVHTGNHVLDIVLAEKRSICMQHKIELTTMAEGSELGFLEELDLYSLIGNALNNAIDAVSVLDASERYIILSITSDHGMVSIHIENPFSGEIVMENGLPKSQRDASFHGFGMKSMERTVEKYGGTMAINTDNGIFSLDILLLNPHSTK